jgi:hypothetical protein
MDRPVLYFPYMHVRDDNWLTAAALFWPSVVRVVPPGLKPRDSPQSRSFAEAGLLTSIAPDHVAYEGAHDLLSAILNNAEGLRDRFTIHSSSPMRDDDAFSPWMRGTAPPSLPKQLAWIHVVKIKPSTLDALEDLGLTVRGEAPPTGSDEALNYGDWIGMHPALAAAYMTVMTQDLGRSYGYETATDQSRLDAPPPGSGLDAALAMLAPPDDAGGRSTPIRAAFATMAVQCVIPSASQRLAPEKVIQVRTELAGELDQFRTFVAEQDLLLAEIASVRNPDRQMQLLAEHLERAVRRPLEDLEKGYRQLGIATIRGLIAKESYLAPAAVAAAGELLDFPSVAVSSVGVAIGIGAVTTLVRREQRDRRRQSGVAYLLDVRRAANQATARRWVSRLRRNSSDAGQAPA